MPVARRPLGRTFYQPVTAERTAMYERERIAEAEGMGIWAQAGRAALEALKVIGPPIVQAGVGLAGAYFGAKRGVAAAQPGIQLAVEPPIAGAAPMARPRRQYGYVDPYTGEFVPTRKPRRRKKKKRAYPRRRRAKKPLIDKETMNMMLMMKLLKD